MWICKHPYAYWALWPEGLHTSYYLGKQKFQNSSRAKNHAGVGRRSFHGLAQWCLLPNLLALWAGWAVPGPSTGWIQPVDSIQLRGLCSPTLIHLQPGTWNTHPSPDAQEGIWDGIALIQTQGRTSWSWSWPGCMEQGQCLCPVPDIPRGGGGTAHQSGHTQDRERSSLAPIETCTGPIWMCECGYGWRWGWGQQLGPI